MGGGFDFNAAKSLRAEYSRERFALLAALKDAGGFFKSLRVQFSVPRIFYVRGFPSQNMSENGIRLFFRRENAGISKTRDEFLKDVLKCLHVAAKTINAAVTVCL